MDVTPVKHYGALYKGSPYAVVAIGSSSGKPAAEQEHKSEM